MAEENFKLLSELIISYNYACETTDSSNSEQVTIILHWITEYFQVHEEFIGLYKVPSVFAETLTA